MTRVIYHLPPGSAPAGGVNTMIEHARILRRAGIESYAYARDRTGLPSHLLDDPVLLFGDIQITNSDLLIRSEVTPIDTLRAAGAAGCRQAIFVQNHFYAVPVLALAPGFEDLGICGVIASSEAIAAFISGEFDLPDVPVVPYAVETPPEVPAKRPAIAYMPRKRGFEARFIRDLVDHRLTDQDAPDWVKIDNLPADEALRRVAECSVFLSLQRFEGFGLPALEAMGQGCLACGFTGLGGRDYAQAQNGYWVDEDDLIGAADAVVEAWHGLSAGDPSTIARISKGREMAACFDAVRRDRRLLEVVRNLL